MKTIRNICMFLFLFVACPANKAQVISYQVFYDELSPYGHWVDFPGLGYAWVPDAGPGFIPYSTGGYWVYTSYGWTWVSDYSWGWAPFHYGRWYFDPFYGWIWLPGNVWGPAWVVWRHCPGYYGWAPMSPGMTITVITGGNYNLPPGSWIFVDEHHLGDHNQSHYYGPRKNNEQLLAGSTPVNNVYEERESKATYMSGPPREEVEKARGRTVETWQVTSRDKPGIQAQENKVAMYRPPVAADNEAKPRRIETKEDVKPLDQRTDKAIRKPEEKVPQEKNGKIPPPPRDVRKTEPVKPDNTRVKPPTPTPPPPKQQPAPRQQPNPPRQAPNPPRQAPPPPRQSAPAPRPAPAPAPRPAKPPGGRVGPRK